jgi:nitrogen fixation protein FixH
MSLVQTLFGGVLLVVFIHWLLGRFGIANYWRGVISAAVVSTAILSYSLIKGLSLDIVSIHLAVFLTTATVITLFGQPAQRSGNKLHWVPKIFIGFFLVLFVVDGAFVSISTQGVSTYIASMFLPRAKNKLVYTGFSGVTEHNEQAANAENQHLKQLSSLRELGWNIEVDGVKELVAGSKLTNALDVRLHDKQMQPIENATVQIQFFRPGNVNPQAQTRLDDVGKGSYTGQFTIPVNGSWIMRTTIDADGKRIEVERDVSVKAAA